MAHKGLVVTISLLLLLLASPTADSCDCVRLKPLSSSVRTESPFIFEGTVVEKVERSLYTRRTTPDGGTGRFESLQRKVVFEVRRAWNGVTTKRIAVSAIDHTYVVFSRKDAKGELTTSNCSWTVESSKAADVLAHLGQETVPK